jgi:hypothetical protein
MKGGEAEDEEEEAEHGKKNIRFFFSYCLVESSPSVSKVDSASPIMYDSLVVIPSCWRRK